MPSSEDHGNDEHKSGEGNDNEHGQAGDHGGNGTDGHDRDSGAGEHERGHDFEAPEPEKSSIDLDTDLFSDMTQDSDNTLPDFGDGGEENAEEPLEFGDIVKANKNVGSWRTRTEDGQSSPGLFLGRGNILGVDYEAFVKPGSEFGFDFKGEGFPMDKGSIEFNFRWGY